MPYVFEDQLATPGNLTSNGTANTETETAFLKPASSAPVYLAKVSGAGRNSAQTTLNAIELRTRKWGTASTGGTGLSSINTDARGPTATATSGSRPTSGTTATNAGPIVSFSTTGPGFWMTENPDHMIALAAGNAGSISLFDAASLASLLFSFSLKHLEF